MAWVSRVEAGILMDCRKCGAPLPAKLTTCRYCGAVNDVDFDRGAAQRVGIGERLCPHCREPLDRVQVAIGDGLDLDRCGQCLGIFFDPGELGSVLSKAESDGEHVDRQRLLALAELSAGEPPPEIRYVPCPDCGNLMNRSAYGRRSGVVVDHCRDHGTWLDGGELRSLVDWVRAGGRQHQRQLEKEEVADLERRRAAAERGPAGSILTASPVSGRRRHDNVLIEGLFALGDLLSSRR